MKEEEKVKEEVEGKKWLDEWRARGWQRTKETDTHRQTESDTYEETVTSSGKARYRKT